MRGSAILILAILTGCASGPQPPAAPSAPPAPAAKAATPAPAAATHTTVPGIDPEVLAKARTLNLKPRTFGGQIRFCKDEAKVGTRFVTTTCASEDQLDQMLRDAEAARDRMMHGAGCAGSVPNSASSCGGG